MRYLPLLPLVLLAFSPLVHADETPVAEEEGDIAQWVKELDADDYGTRQAAQQKLEKAGESAIDSVREAALGESQEAASRAIDILRKHVQGTDSAVKNAATAALKKLAEGENAIVADRAENALRPAPDKPEQPQENVRPAGPRVIPFGGRGGIRIEARAIQIGGKGARKVSIKNVDGNKEIDVEEGERKIKIVESADGHIKLKVEGKKDDMDGSMEVEADNEEDLKKKDPEAHKIYKKYANGGVGGAKIEFGAFPAGPRGIRIAPALPRAVPDLPDEKRKEVEERLKEALKRLEAAQEGFGIEAIPAEGADARIEALEKIRAQLEKQVEEVQKQIDAAKEE